MTPPLSLIMVQSDLTEQEVDVSLWEPFAKLNCASRLDGFETRLTNFLFPVLHVWRDRTQYREKRKQVLKCVTQ